MSAAIKDYLGDSVYVSYDGYGILLYTENGMGPSNNIFLEPQVLAALDKFRERIKSIAAEKGQA